MPIENLLSENLFPSRQARVAVIRYHRHKPYGQHRHDFCEVVLICGGTGVHVTGRFQQELERGDVVVITGRRAHAYEKPQGLSLINILIRHEVLPKIGGELGTLGGYHALFGSTAKHKPFASHMRLSPEEFLQVEEWAERLESETRQDDPSSRLLAEAYLILILGVLCRCYGHKEEVRTRSTAKFNLALDTIEKKFAQPLVIADLAQQIGMSERSLFRSFQSHLGVSPAKHLLKIRIQHACQRLIYGDPTRHISEIAQECGFEDSNYFSRAFRQEIGISPREYRHKRTPTQ